MTDDRYDLLQPTQLTATFRSLPRRYRAAVAPVAADAELVGRRVDGERVVDLVADAVRTLALVDRALEATFTHDLPVVVQGVVDASARDWPASAPDDLRPLLDELDDVAAGLGERSAQATLEDWGRRARVAGGLGEREAVALAREGARTAAENLRRVERLVARLS